MKINTTTLDIATAKEPDLTRFPLLRGWEELSPLYTLIGQRGIIAGGFAAYAGSPHDDPILPGDIDIFAISNEAAWDITVELCKARNWTYTMSPIAYTIQPSLVRPNTSGFERPVQVVMPDPKWKLSDYALRFQQAIILESFDFDICRGCVLDKDTVLGDPRMGQRQASIRVIRDPVMSMRRVLKYMRKGVEFRNEELFKLIWSYHTMRPNEQMVISDQYTIDTPEPKSVYNVRVEPDSRWLMDYTLFEDMTFQERFISQNGNDVIF